MLSDFYNLFIIPIHHSFFQARYHLEQLLKYVMLSPLSRTVSVWLMKLSSGNHSNVLNGERFLHIFC